MQRKLLIVEDNNDLYEGMDAALQSELTRSDVHVEIRRATTFIEAKRLLREFAPHLISVDMQFPLREGSPIEINMGAELVRYVQERFRTPIILYSGSEMEEIKRLLHEAGAREVEVIRKKAGNIVSWVRALMKYLT